MAENTDRSLLYRIPSQKEPLNRGNNHLFVIGINAYKNLGKLENAVRDAQAFRDVLTERYRFEKAHIYELYDEEATRRNIMSNLRKMVGKLKPDDSLILYFSGHGHFDPVFKEGYWVPVDASYDVIDDYIPYTFIQQMARAVPARHLLMIVDSCYSGAVLVRERDVAKERLERDPSRWIIASGRNEVVPDSDLIEEKHSPFAKQLLDLLRDYSQDGLTTLGLVDRLTENVSYNSKQTPIGQALQGVGHKGGQFIFYPRKNEARDWGEALQKNSVADFQLFIKNYPQSAHIDEAHWQIAQVKHTKEAYRHYLGTQAAGKFRLKANEQILAIEDLQRFTQAKRQGEGALGIFIEKYPYSAHRQAALDEIRRIHEGDSTKSRPAESKKTPPPPARKEEKRQSKAATKAPEKQDSIPLMRRPAVKYGLIGLPVLLLMIWGVMQFANKPDNSTTQKYNKIVQEADLLLRAGLEKQDPNTVRRAMDMYDLVLKQFPKSPAATRGRKNAEQWLNSQPARPAEGAEPENPIITKETEEESPPPPPEPVDPIEERKKEGYVIVSPWTDGVAIYRKDREMGLINKEGQLQGRSYPLVSDLAYGFARYQNSGKYGFLNYAGREVIPAKYDNVEPFNRSGLANVRIGSWTSVINTTGRCVKNCEDPKVVAARRKAQAAAAAAAEAEAIRKAENSKRKVRITMVKLVCTMSDDEGSSNDADMDRFTFTVAASQKSCSDGRNKSLPENGKTIYQYASGAITTPRGTTWRDQNKSLEITFDNEHCKELHITLNGYARESDGSSKDEEARASYTIPNKTNPNGNYSFELRSPDFAYTCYFNIKKIDW